MAQSDAASSAPSTVLNETYIEQILYTSGTTSDPKGAMRSHRSLMSEYSSCLLHLDIKEAELLEHAQQHLTPFKDPKAIHLVTTLPKNSAGKLLKPTLRTLFG